MHGLFLYGLNCQPWVWDGIKDHLTDFDIDYAAYPRDVTIRCSSAADLAEWVFENHVVNHPPYDFILGHSMGGIIALHLSAKPEMHLQKTILVESFLKPTAPFYRNLMMESNKATLGEKVYAMLKEEDVHYTMALKSSLKENFDYTKYLEQIHHPVYALYGDRGRKDYPFLLDDLNLNKEHLERLLIGFVDQCCHLPMLENPLALARHIVSILS